MPVSAVTGFNDSGQGTQIRVGNTRLTPPLERFLSALAEGDVLC